MCSNPKELFGCVGWIWGTSSLHEDVELPVHQSAVEERLSLHSDFLLAFLELSFSARS